MLKTTLLLLASVALAFTVKAKPGWTLEQCIDHYGTAHLLGIVHETLADIDYGACDYYTFGDSGRYGTRVEVYILRHNVGVLKAGTVCEQINLNK